MKVTLPSLLAIAILAFAAGVSAETVYQWVDDNGVTQFGSQPPRGREYRQLKTQTGHSEPVDYSSRYKSENQDEETDEPTRSGPSEKELAAACENAMRNLEMLERGGRVTVEDDNGQRRYLDDTEQAERAEEAREIRDRAC